MFLFLLGNRRGKAGKSLHHITPGCVKQSGAEEGGSCSWREGRRGRRILGSREWQRTVLGVEMSPQSRTASGSCPRKVLRSSTYGDNPKHEAADLKKCSHLQGSNEDVDIEQTVDTGQGGEGGMNGESNRKTKRLPCVK